MGYIPNKNKVVSEIFEDEVVVVNLESGTYYSFRKAALGVWKMIEAGCNHEQIMAYADEVEAVNSFLQYLGQDSLIISDDLIVAEWSFNDRLEGKPEYNKYEDMKDLLLLDPIHEVDQSGWPNKKKE